MKNVYKYASALNLCAALLSIPSVIWWVSIFFSKHPWEISEHSVFLPLALGGVGLFISVYYLYRHKRKGWFIGMGSLALISLTSVVMFPIHDKDVFVKSILETYFSKRVFQPLLDYGVVNPGFYFMLFILEGIFYLTVVRSRKT